MPVDYNGVVNPLLAALAVMVGAAAIRFSGELASAILGQRRPIDPARLGPERLATMVMGAALLLVGLLGLAGILR